MYIIAYLYYFYIISYKLNFNNLTGKNSEIQRGKIWSKNEIVTLDGERERKTMYTQEGIKAEGKHLNMCTRKKTVTHSLSTKIMGSE